MTIHSFITKINFYFNSLTCDYINDLTSKKLRQCKNGLQIKDILLYQFMYSKINVTKDNVCNNINFANKTSIDRTNYYRKENNIPLIFYKNITKQITLFCQDFLKQENKVIAIDGTYSNISNKSVLNMGYYDVNTKLAIDLVHGNIGQRNHELKCCIKYIKDNVDEFKNTIIICDRAYYSYSFMKFLEQHKIDYIIRCKNNCKNKEKFTRLISYEDIYDKIIFTRHTKHKEKTKHILEVKNNCIIATNIKDKTDEELLNMYKSRWTIETYFKLIKKNFKIQNIKEKQNTCVQNQKIYYCTICINNIMEVINFYLNKNDYIVNKSILIEGIYKCLLEKIIQGNVTYDDIENIKKYFNKKCTNKENRNFPRISKTPFTKWYVKSYSNHNNLNYIIKKILSEDIQDLNKNQKLIVNSINKIKDLYGDILKTLK